MISQALLGDPAALATRLRDALGRELLLRGINAGGRSKWPPFAPFAFSESGRAEQTDAPAFEAAAAAYFERLRGWGMTLIRLPFSWEALEPHPGRYDMRAWQRSFARWRPGRPSSSTQPVAMR